MVKKSIITAVVAVAIVAVGVASVAHYNQYKNKQVVAAQRAAQASVAQATAAKQKQADFLKEFQHIQGECERAAQAWNVLPASVRAKVAAPDCALSRPIDQ